MKHNSIAPLRSIPSIRRTLSAISIFLSFVFALAAFGAPLGTAFTYQGQLKRSGAAYNGTCNFQFSLWDAASGGGQFTIPPINGVNVVNGLFTVTIDFSDVFFAGEARWLGTSVQCSGDPGFTPLDPRQPITATPYALSLRPGADIAGSVADVGGALSVTNSHSFGVGIRGSGNDAGVVGTGNGASGKGVSGLSTGAGAAIYGENNSEFGFAGEFAGGVKITGGTFLVTANSGDYAALFTGKVDVTGAFTTTNSSSSGIGVDGSSFIGVHGKTTSAGGSGVWGEALLSNSAGVYGTNRDSAAIWGRTSGAGSAIYGDRTGGATGYAGYFAGPVHVQGTLTKSAGTFKIDHPLDPANKFLSHSFVESPDMKNIYDGNVTTDATGSATVMLPDYFTALNRDYRYQLTVLGQFAQAIVSREIAGNSFEIQTDKPGVKVSWQVTGIRQDAYAKANPIVVEESKPAEEKGLYIYPAGFGAGEEKGIGHSSRPTEPGAQKPTGDQVP